MARVNIPVTVMAGGVTRNALAAWTNGDHTNGHAFINSGREVLEVRNGGGSSTDVTIISVADPATGRTADDQAVAIAAGATHRFGTFPPHLYNQPAGGTDGGRVRVDLSASSSVTLSVFRPA